MQKYVISYNANGVKINHYTWTSSYIEDFFRSSVIAPHICCLPDSPSLNAD